MYEDVGKAFYILRVTLDGTVGGSDFEAITQAPMSVRGNIPGLHIAIGTWFGFDAEWTTHKQYGKQLLIKRAPIVKQTWDTEGALKVLLANGVGPRICSQIKDHLGDQMVAGLSDVKVLEGVPGLDTFSALFVHQKWAQILAYYKGLSFLLDLNLPPGLVRRVWATFGDDVTTTLSKNPWALTQIDGITFQQADEVAQRLGLDPNSPDRLQGLIIATTKTHRAMGHLYLETHQLMAEATNYMSFTSAEFGAALVACHKAETVVIDRDARPGLLAVYDPWSHHLEKSSALSLGKRLTTAGFGAGGLKPEAFYKRLASFGPETEAATKEPTASLASVAEAAVEEWGKSNQLVLSSNQKLGSHRALTCAVSILTGLPGTGKTTSLRAVVNILQDSGVKFLLCAPTGIAAKNLSTLTGAPASTIHRAFSARGKREEKRDASYSGIKTGADDGALTAFSEKDENWGYGELNPYPAEVLIIDEVSMLDQHLLYRVLECTSPETRLVFVGDAAQLPSVGPGNVLRDMIRSGLFPVTNLQEIFRQQDTSAIVYASHAIYRGNVPDCDHKTDFTLIPVNSEDQAQQVILALAEKLYQKRANFQVLSPRHAGAAGVTTLNKRMRDLLNPALDGLQEFRLGQDEIIREDDRIMVVKNDYDLGVFNGDVGKVARVDQRAKVVEIKVFGDPVLDVSIPFKVAPSMLRLAYSCTVHKAQGLEYDTIVMPLLDSFRHQLQRNLLYTAVTRAKRKVFLVGTYTALATAVQNDREDLRNTLLNERLSAFSATLNEAPGVVKP